MQNLKINNNIKRILGCKKAIIAFSLVLGTATVGLTMSIPKPEQKEVIEDSFEFESFKFNLPKGKLIHGNQIINMNILDKQYGAGKHLIMPLDEAMILNLFNEISTFEKDHRYYDMLTEKYSNSAIDRYAYSIDVDSFLEIAPDLEKNMDNAFDRFSLYQNEKGLEWKKLYKNFDDENNTMQNYFDEMTNFYQELKEPSLKVKEMHVRMFLFEYESYINALEKNGYNISDLLIKEKITFTK